MGGGPRGTHLSYNIFAHALSDLDTSTDKSEKRPLHYIALDTVQTRQSETPLVHYIFSFMSAASLMFQISVIQPNALELVRLEII